MGCYSFERGQIKSLEEQNILLGHYSQRPFPVQACGSAARSQGLTAFAVHDRGECLGDKNLSSIIPLLNVSDKCSGGRGGKNAIDVYRFTSKHLWSIFWLSFLNGKDKSE